MGRVTSRAPKYVHGFVDRHGKARFYFRRPGFRQVRLPGLPWSPEFMQAYEAALAGQNLDIGSKRVKPGSMRALAVSYYNSPEFRAMKASTQSVRRNIVDRFCGETDNEGRKLGDKNAGALQREHVVKFMAARSDKPESANGLRKALRAMMQHAVEMGLRAEDPTRDVKAIRSSSKGYHSWTDDEIAQFETQHLIGSRARLALALLLYTGQRRSDVVRMGRQHIRDGLLQVQQDKGGTELQIPLLPALATTIAATPSDHLTFLVTEFGRPFTAAGFGNWFRDRCNEAGLKHCSAQGRRPTAGRGGLHRAPDSGDHRARQLARDRSLHQGRRPDASGGGGHGEGEKENIDWQTRRKVSQKGEKTMKDQCDILVMAPRAGVSLACDFSRLECQTPL
jgi:integrase